MLTIIGGATPPDNREYESMNQKNPSSEDHGGNGEAGRSLFRRYPLFFWVGAALCVALVAIGVFVLLMVFVQGAPYKGPTYVVKRAPMEVTIVERGSLESAKNEDIIVRVKAGTRGSTNASTIKWVIDDGTEVKEGDKLVELDDSGFQDQLKTQRNNFNKAKSDWVKARTDIDIQQIENLSRIKTAEVNKIQAALELNKYAGEAAGKKIAKFETQEQVRAYLLTDFEPDVKKESQASNGKFTSVYLQDQSVIKGTIETAIADKNSWMDRAAWSQRMVKKGFYSLSQADADDSRLQSMIIALRKAEGDLDIYEIFEREKNVTKKWSDVKETERSLDKEIKQADANMEQKKAIEATNKLILDQETDRLNEMLKDEKLYVMYAPQKGMVVYYIPEQARFGGGSQQATVAQGEPVRESQKLIRIPTLSKMLVRVKVHEANIAKVRGREYKPTGYSDALRSGFTLGQLDFFAQSAYHFSFEEIHEKFKNKDQELTFKGQSATIRVDAEPGKSYNGHVKSKATVPSQGDFLSSDVKLYETIVPIDDLDPKNEKLKPGMSAEVTILAESIKEPILSIPIDAVVGNVKMGADRLCFVLDTAGIPREREIKLRRSNDTMVEVVSGLEEGETVVRSPRALIPEKSGMTVATPGGRKGGEFDEGGKKVDKKGDTKKGFKK
jgi:multidrug efflux pump subunit AcrA (membrane-fusion protein)